MTQEDEEAIASIIFSHGNPRELETEYHLGHVESTGEVNVYTDGGRIFSFTPHEEDETVEDIATRAKLLISAHGYEDIFEFEEAVLHK